MPTWVTFLLSFAAVGFGWLLSEFSFSLRTRPSVEVNTVASRLYRVVPVAANQRFSAVAGTYLAAGREMDERIVVLIRLDVSIINKSLAPDQLTGVRLSRTVRTGVPGLSAVLADGGQFVGCSVSAASATFVTLWFVVDRPNYAEWLDDPVRSYVLDLTFARAKSQKSKLDLGGVGVAWEPGEPVRFDAVAPPV